MLIPKSSQSSSNFVHYYCILIILIYLICLYHYLRICIRYLCKCAKKSRWENIVEFDGNPQTRATNAHCKGLFTKEQYSLASIYVHKSPQVGGRYLFILPESLSFTFSRVFVCKVVILNRPQDKRRIQILRSLGRYVGALCLPIYICI